MLKAIYNGRIGEIVSEYERDSIQYVTILFDDVETNWILKSLIEII